MEESLLVSLRRILNEKREMLVERKKRIRLASILVPAAAGLAAAIGWFVKKR